MKKKKVVSLNMHKLRHRILHNALDELVEDFIKTTCSIPSEVSLLDFIEWSARQRKFPEGAVDAHNKDRQYYNL